MGLFSHRLLATLGIEITSGLNLRATQPVLYMYMYIQATYTCTYVCGLVLLHLFEGRKWITRTTKINPPWNTPATRYTTPPSTTQLHTKGRQAKVISTRTCKNSCICNMYMYMSIYMYTWKTIKHGNAIPYSQKSSRDPIFAKGPSAKISKCNFHGWTFRNRECVLGFSFCGFNRELLIPWRFPAIQ